MPGPPTDRAFALGNAAISAIAVALLAWILLGREPSGDEGALTFMPAVNAVFNTLSACCLVAGIFAIRGGQKAQHRVLMLSALASSACFLVGYLVYHYVHGDTPFPAGHPWRVGYLVLLASHVILSVVVLPMVFWTFGLAFRGRFVDHKRWAKRTFPLWLYVSVTGVIVFLVLRAVRP